MQNINNKLNKYISAFYYRLISRSNILRPQGIESVFDKNARWKISLHDLQWLQPSCSDQCKKSC